MKKLLIVFIALFLFIPKISYCNDKLYSNSLELLNVLYLLKEPIDSCSPWNTVFSNEAKRWFYKYSDHIAVKDFNKLTDIYSREEFTDIFLNHYLQLKAWRLELLDFMRESNSDVFFRGMEDYYSQLELEKQYYKGIMDVAESFGMKCDLYISPIIIDDYYILLNNNTISVVLGMQGWCALYPLFITDEVYIDILFKIQEINYKR
jgi:hypothetical protein